VVAFEITAADGQIPSATIRQRDLQRDGVSPGKSGLIFLDDHTQLFCKAIYYSCATIKL